MGRFAKSSKQARRALSVKIAIGSSRRRAKGDGMIHSIRTANHYEGALADVAQWLKDTRAGHGLPKLTVEEAQYYLADRSVSVGQTALDQARKAIETHLGVPIGRITSEKVQLLGCRRYEHDQTNLVAKAQAERNAISTKLADAAGLRSKELLTIRPLSEQPPSERRQWSDQRFLGREDWTPYTVIGKGGLCREVRIAPDLALQLEARRLAEPKVVMDRGVKYLAHYDLGGGNSWSKSFSDASQRALGWSNGGHGLRHTFAQDRMAEYQGAGYTYRDALRLVAQELGHFCPSTTEVYLR